MQTELIALGTLTPAVGIQGKFLKLIFEPR
jgi:hypothetical protein